MGDQLTGSVQTALESPMELTGRVLRGVRNLNPYQSSADLGSLPATPVRDQHIRTPGGGLLLASLDDHRSDGVLLDRHTEAMKRHADAMMAVLERQSHNSDLAALAQQAFDRNLIQGSPVAVP